jgi:hypothetical protein
MKRKLLRGLSIALLTVLLTLVVGVLAIRWLRPKVIHQRPYKWDAFVLPMMNFTNEPIVNVVKAVNDAVRKASGGTVETAVHLDSTPAPVKKFAPNAEVDGEMDRMIAAFREYEASMLKRGANGFESAPYSGPMGGGHSLGCTFQMCVQPSGLGYAEQPDAIHLWRQPRTLECRAYSITPPLVARIEPERKSNSYLVDAEPVVSVFAHATGSFEWTLMVPDGLNQWVGEERIDKIFRHLAGQNLILAIGTPEEHSEAESRLKTAGLWQDLPVTAPRP